MFSALNFFINKRKENVKKCERQKRIEFERLIDKLLQDDEENQEFIRKAEYSDCKIDELEWTCTKHDGTVTWLNDNSGLINDKYEFSKIKALEFWSLLKIGSRVSFLLFEKSITSLKLLDSAWGEDINDNHVAKIDETAKKGYMTDFRTIIGTVEEVTAEYIKIDIGRTKEYFPADKSQEWKFVAGDNVKLECIITEDETVWNPSIGMFGEIVEVKSIAPNCIKNEIGRITASYDSYAVFDESIILSFANKLSQKKIALWDEYEYEAIETSTFTDGRNFNWRITKLIKKILKDSDRQIDIVKKIQLTDEFFELKQSKREMTKFTTIFNNSDQKLIIKKCSVTANSGYIELQKPDKKYELRPFNGAYKIYFDIIPKQYGLFVEELTVDFGYFKKKCLIKFQVTRSMASSRPNQYACEIIPGQKIHSTTRFIEIRIPEYLIPDQFRHNFDFKKQTQLLVHDFFIHDHGFLIEPMQEQNYLAKMRYFLYLQEISNEIHFERYKIDRAHFENKNEFLKLEIEGVGERRPAISMGDTIHASDPFQDVKKAIFIGNIFQVKKDAILAKFNSDFHASHDRKDYRIDFHFSRTSFRRQQFALDQVLSPNGLGLTFLFPKLLNAKKNPQLDVKMSANEKILLNGKEMEFYNKSLNIYQKNAVINVLRGEIRPLPYVIFGPPGTGKTRTVVECIKQISKNVSYSRIIVATPSNSAANLIVENLVDSGIFKGGDFIRFVSYHQIEKGLIPQHLKKYCATIDIGHDKDRENKKNLTKNEPGMMLNASKSIIVRYKIYISTLSNLGALMHIKFLRDHFTHVIIDEAGQSVEPESLIPISLLSQNKGQVILAGDPKQLGPVLTSHAAKFCGFEKSFLERITEEKYYLPIYGENKNQFDEKFVTKLKKNYRSVPSILSIYSELFYSNELQAEISQENSKEIEILESIDSILWNRNTANRKCGAYFVDVNGENLKSIESTSWYNNQEASRVFFFVCKLKKLGIDLKNVGVITPYNLQVKNLKRIFNESMPDSDLKVGSVEEFQGQEKDIILISTVRTNAKLLATDQKFGLGFLQCAKRMNVAISRARAVLIVFGKESLLDKDDNWSYYIQYTKDNGTFVANLPN